MSLVIAKAICRREFGTDSVPEQFIDVLRRSSAIELATVIKGNGLPPATKLLKIYATSPEGARRIVHLLSVEDGSLFLLFFRDKKVPVSWSSPSTRYPRSLRQAQSLREGIRLRSWQPKIRYAHLACHELVEWRRGRDSDWVL